ncbi:MAG: hypothetical protein WED01_15435 [Candidatus Rokuibacteriota bacterium]
MQGPCTCGPGEFRIIGPLTLGVYDWTHPRPGRPVMFSLGFFEWFTCARPRTLAMIYLPASVGLLWYGLHAGVSTGQTVILFAAGLLLWTLLEYLLHRLGYDLLHYAIHRGPLPSRWGRALRAHHLMHC